MWSPRLVRRGFGPTRTPSVRFSASFSSSACWHSKHASLREKGPLYGLKVVDLTRVLAGPFCSQILADYGADVVKIEQPGQGDETRTWKSKNEDAKWKDKTMSLYFSAVNRNKRSLTLDLKKPKAIEILHEVVKSADVLIENFVPGKADKLGLSYAQLSSLNPRLIYASVSGYGSAGPYSDRAGYDAIAAAEGGLMHITGFPNGPPIRPGLGMTDISTGLLAHGAILAALYARQTTGRGQYISASLFETQLALLTNVGTTWLNTGFEGKRWGAAHPSIVPYNTYQAKEGAWLALGANNDRQFRVLCQRLDRAEWATDKRYSTNAARVEEREVLDSMVGELIRQKTTQEWMKVFHGSGLAHGPVNTIRAALEHPQAEAREMVQEVACESWDGAVLKMIGPAVKLSETPAKIRRRAPTLGEHVDEVLQEVGYSAKDVQTLKDNRVT